MGQVCVPGWRLYIWFCKCKYPLLVSVTLEWLQKWDVLASITYSLPFKELFTRLNFIGLTPEDFNNTYVVVVKFFNYIFFLSYNFIVLCKCYLVFLKRSLICKNTINFFPKFCFHTTFCQFTETISDTFLP